MTSARAPNSGGLRLRRGACRRFCSAAEDDLTEDAGAPLLFIPHWLARLLLIAMAGLATLGGVLLYSAADREGAATAYQRKRF
eukprot:COSAG01_NODE_12958_length_1657_cov_1.470475_2_plen_83_part_00